MSNETKSVYVYNQELGKTEILNLTQFEIEELERKRLVEEILEDSSAAQMEVSFGKNSMGRHEVVHTSSFLANNWGEYNVNHTSVVIESDLYHEALKIEQMMHDFYQKVATK